MAFLALGIGSAATMLFGTLCMLGALNASWWAQDWESATLWNYKVEANFTRPWEMLVDDVQSWETVCTNDQARAKVCETLKWMRPVAVVATVVEAVSVLFTITSLFIAGSRQSKRMSLLCGRLFIDSGALALCALTFMGAHQIQDIIIIKPSPRSSKGMYLANLSLGAAIVSVLLVLTTSLVVVYKNWDTIQVDGMTSVVTGRSRKGTGHGCPDLEGSVATVNRNSFGGQQAFGLNTGPQNNGTYPGIAPAGQWHQQQQFQQQQITEVSMMKQQQLQFQPEQQPWGGNSQGQIPNGQASRVSFDAVQSHRSGAVQAQQSGRPQPEGYGMPLDRE